MAPPPPPLPSRTLDVPSSDPAISLRVRLASADAAPDTTPSTSPRLGLLLLHAYPRLGGSSNDPVITALYHAARKGGAFTLVVRYDQRGVGGSGGRRCVWGWADAADAAALATRARDGTLAPGVPAVDRLYVVGYSWGAALAAMGVVEGGGSGGTAGWVGVSPPLGGLSGLALRTGRATAALASAPDVPGLVLMGDRDQFCSVAAATRAVDRVNEGRKEGGQQQLLDLVIVEGADHFWGGATAWCPSWGEVAGRVLEWVAGVEARRG